MGFFNSYYVADLEKANDRSRTANTFLTAMRQEGGDGGGDQDVDEEDRRGGGRQRGQRQQRA